MNAAKQEKNMQTNLVPTKSCPSGLSKLWHPACLLVATGDVKFSHESMLGGEVAVTKVKRKKCESQCGKTLTFGSALFYWTNMSQSHVQPSCKWLSVKSGTHLRTFYYYSQICIRFLVGLGACKIESNCNELLAVRSSILRS